MKYFTTLTIYILFIGCRDMGEPQLSGCMNLEACNYNENATTNDENSCNVNDECGVCGGNSSTCNISYTVFVQDIFNNYCINCHGNSGGLNLTNYENLMFGGNSGQTIIPNNGSNSLLIKKLRGTANGQIMPPNQCCLDENTIITLIETWIDEGAQNN